MAFIPVLPAPPAAPSTHRATTPVMSTRVTRRAALRVAAFSLAAAATGAIAGQFDLKELKDDVEELKYDEEVTEVGPDPAEKNILRTKKKPEEPKYRKEEEELRKREDEGFDAMVAREKEEDEKLRAKFSKK